MNQIREYHSMLPMLGCLTLLATMLAVMMFLCLMPVMVYEVMLAALKRLHLNAEFATLSVLGIFAGSFINLPIRRIERSVIQPQLVVGPTGLGVWSHRFRRERHESLLAVNVGGCLIPLALAAWQVPYLFRSGMGITLILLLVTAANILVCNRVARPVPGIGIVMPGFISPLVAVLLTWLLTLPLGEVGEVNRAPIAFVAGVTGPLLGADLLHLRDMLKTPAAVLSIGGAGTFDGIVLSGVLAALLA